MSLKSPSWIWYENMTTDLEAAARFYQATIGLSTEAWPDPAMQYTLLKTASGAMGGMALLPEEAKAMGAPPHWLGVVGVADTDAIVGRARALGAKVYAGPFDIPGVGRYAILADPTGATFAVLAPEGEDQAAPDRLELGRVSWNELWSSDPEAAWAFYQELFGWEGRGTMDMGPQGTYRMYGEPGAERSLGGIAGLMPGQPASAWCFYMNVDDVDTAVNRIREAGGTVVMEPMDVPGGGRMMMALDPLGACFAAYSHGTAG